MAKQLTCAIIDDEPLAVKLLESYAQKTSFLNLVATYGSAVEAMYALQTSPVDILFLDIQMPDLTGLDFARMIPSSIHVFSRRPSVNLPSTDIRWALSTIS